MVREFNHIGLWVCDVDAAIRLYGDILGGKLIRNAISKDGRSRYIYIQLGSSVLEILRAGAPAQQGFGHLAFLTDGMGLDNAYRHLADEGYRFTVLPKAAGSGDGRLAFFMDDSGITYEFLEREEHIRLKPFETELVREFMYVTVSVRPESLSRSQAFMCTELSFAEAGGLYRLGCDTVRLTVSDKPKIESITLKAADAGKAFERLESEGFAPERSKNGFTLTGAGMERIEFI